VTVPNYPVPMSILHIEGDPTAWGLADVGPQNPNWGSDPVALAIIGPLTGTLLLAPAHVSGFALVPPPLGDGWIPGIKAVSPYLYLPDPKGVSSDSPGYWLAPPDTNLDTLQQDIMNAMLDGSSLAVNITAVSSGVVVLNGAQLPFVVLGDAEGNA
jgi:hypothetical protein